MIPTIPTIPTRFGEIARRALLLVLLATACRAPDTRCHESAKVIRPGGGWDSFNSCSPPARIVVDQIGDSGVVLVRCVCDPDYPRFRARVDGGGQ